MYEYNKKLTIENHLTFLFGLKDDNGVIKYNIYAEKYRKNKSYYHVFKHLIAIAIGTDTTSCHT